MFYPPDDVGKLARHPLSQEERRTAASNLPEESSPMPQLHPQRKQGDPCVTFMVHNPRIHDALSTGSSTSNGEMISEVGDVEDPSDDSATSVTSSNFSTETRLKSGYVPFNPYKLSRMMMQLLEWTELPFMILWIYLSYFLVIVGLSAHKVRTRVWVSALVAGTLVGVGLNANAYRAIMYRGYPDVGMIVRFFLIPFGVSALSGMTHSLRENFLLVFPVDPIELLIAFAVPTVVVCTLLLSRIIILYKRSIPINLRNFLLNGRIYF